MRRTFVVTTLMVVAATISCPSLAGKIKVYKWVDQNGVVTFSEYRPETTQYVELEVEGDRVIGGKNQQLNYDFSNLDDGDVDETVVTELNQKANEYCQKAKHNLNVLESFNRVRVLDDEGQPKVLDEGQVTEQRRLAKRQIDIFCKKESQ